MKHKKYIIGTLIIIGILSLFFVKPYRTEAPTRVPTKTFRPEVLSITASLYQKSQEYRAQEQRKQEIEEELASLEEALVNLRESAAAYDTILCRDYQVRYVRPTPAALSGTTLFDTACVKDF
jgi:hypothetical protein